MARYHVNPETGVPGQCNAHTRACPFGDVPHRESPREAVAAFETYMTDSIAADAGSERLLFELNLAQQHRDATKAKRDAIPYADRQRRQHAQIDYDDAVNGLNNVIAEFEQKGLGHRIPDNGPTLRVATREQKIHLQQELLGQISDGMWENTANTNWEQWHRATIVVDPRHVGRNFGGNHIKDNFQLNSTELLNIVGDRMIESVQKDTGNDNYDMKQMRKELAHLRKIFKTQRPVHDGNDESPATPRVTSPLSKPAAPAPTANPPQGIPVPTSAPSDHSDVRQISLALRGPGATKAKQEFFTLHAGMANPVNGEGDDYDHIKNGGVVIIGKRDGSRAKVIAGAGEHYANPADELGRPLRQIKQQQNRDAVNEGYYVLGYRDAQGKQYGWVPDKRIQYFVFK